MPNSDDNSQVILSTIEKRLELSLNAKRERLEEAMVILLAYAGFSIDTSRDYAKGTSQGGSLPNWFDDRVVLNVLQPIARTTAAIISSNNPSWLVEPIGDSASKFQAARGVQQLLDYFYRSNEIGPLLDDVVLRAVLLGFAGFYVDWDDQIGVGNIGDSEEARKGWFVVEPVDPFMLHFEPGVGGVDRAHWVMRESTMHIEEARLFFNNPDILPELTNSDEASTVKRHLNLVSDTEGSTSDPSEGSERIRVLHYWQRPGITYPDGLEVIVAGDRVVSLTPRLLGGEIPIYTMRFILEPHRDYGSGVGSGLLQLQRDLSMTWNAYRARRDQEVMPPWLVPLGSAVRNINTRPGAINEINPKFGSPQAMRFDPFSQVVGTLGDRTVGMMEYISGINDASRGEAPTSNATGRLTAFLAELDNRRLGPTIRSMASMLSRVGKRMVRLWQTYGSESITVTVLGKSHTAEISEIRRADLLWRDIDVDIASLMPRTQPLRQETVLNLLSMGAVSRDEARDALEFGGFDEAMGMRSMEALNARSTLEELEDISVPLEKIPVSEFVDHETYMRVYKRYLVLESPGEDIRARIEQQIAKHKEILTMAAQQAQMAQGGPPGGPQGGPPIPGGDIMAGAGAAPGGLPADLVTLQEPGVDKAAEEELASMAGLPT